MEEKSIEQMRRELRDLYFNKIKPELASLNKNRRLGTKVTCGVLILLVGFLLAVLQLTVLGLTLIFIGMIITLSFGAKHPATTKNPDGSVTIHMDNTPDSEFKRKFMPEFLRIFGDDIAWKSNSIQAQLNDIKLYKSLNIMNPFLMLSFDDEIEGTYKNVKFNILEADSSLSSVNNIIGALFASIFAAAFGCGCFIFILVSTMSALIAIFKNTPMEQYLHWILLTIILFPPFFGLWKLARRVPFRGCFVEFEMNKNFEGHTFILERNETNRTIKFDRTKFQEVILEDPNFMKRFVVYSDNQVEARYVLTTAFIERFKNMKTAFKAKYIRAAFKDGKITIAIHVGKDLFAMANYSKDSDSHTFTELFEELLSVFELITVLKLNQKIGL